MKYQGYCETCLPLPQQSCDDCAPDGYVRQEDRTKEQWPGWCAECGNSNTLSCESCDWGHEVNGPYLWVAKRKQVTDELQVMVLLAGQIKDAAARLERAARKGR